MRTKILAVIIAIPIVLVGMLFLDWIFYLLYNWIMPYLFHLPTITYLQMVGIMMMISFITWSIRCGKD